ncbi:unnamed protein product [Fusarium equiseti]|uniref:Uncharacterized protein n=1 Tax=Fusarium equiseti TaxID=61235 RepID=A0A8J2N780_FUSEQ|nr:unnamed protein product [Fusarium equiseti]
MQNNNHHPYSSASLPPRHFHPAHVVTRSAGGGINSSEANDDTETSLVAPLPPAFFGISMTPNNTNRGVSRSDAFGRDADPLGGPAVSPPTGGPIGPGLPTPPPPPPPPTAPAQQQQRPQQTTAATSSPQRRRLPHWQRQQQLPETSAKRPAQT